MQEFGKTRFGTAPDGSPVDRIVIGRGDLRAAILTWGASVQDLRLDGHGAPLVLGANTLDPYFGPLIYAGAIVGRVANRIAGGAAVLDGRNLTFDRNEAGRSTLHGGATGTSARNWQLVGYDAAACRLVLTLPDGADGFPGNLAVEVTYSIVDPAGLQVEIVAHSDAPTFCNLASHCYWTLDGAPDLSAHRLQVNAARYLPVSDDLIPDGPPRDVAGTGFDFRVPRSVIGPNAVPLDHNFCLDPGHGLRQVATLSAAGLTLTIETTEPGLQVYDGAGLSVPAGQGLDGRSYGAHAGMALEPQGWPDAPNRPDFPSVILRPGETYRQTSRFLLSRT